MATYSVGDLGRRELLLMSAVLAATGVVSSNNLADGETQPERAGKPYRIGFLRAGPPPKTWVEALQQGLQERGYVVGENVVIEFRCTDGSLDQLPQFAEELVRSKVDVIVASSSPAAVPAKKATTSVPIVFVNVFDPLAIGLVPSLARPEGNVTGLSSTSAELAGKRLGLLKEFVPGLKRVGVLSHPATPSNAKQLEGAEFAARALGIQIQPVAVRDPNDFDSAFEAARGADGLLLLDIALFTTHRDRLVRLAATSRLPAIYGYREMVEAGGLMSYGVSFPDMYRRAATYVDKILKGVKPADLPVEEPTRFEFVINVRAAEALGLTIPRSLAVIADQMIE
jgi:putative ABC transport system substrate-binding protein